MNQLCSLGCVRGELGEEMDFQAIVIVQMSEKRVENKRDV